jgi:transposase
VAEITSFGLRWIEQLLERYNAVGPVALGDLRRGNGGKPSVLKPELLERLGARLDQPPPDGGRWTSGKVARWMADELGLEKLAPQRGWEALKALGWSIQKPRPRNPKAATEAQQEAFKKRMARPVCKSVCRERRITVCCNVSGVGSRLPRQDGDTRAQGLIKVTATMRHFLNQASRTPFDCQALSSSPSRRPR